MPAYSPRTRELKNRAVLVCPFGANDGDFPVLQHKPELEVCFNFSSRSEGFVVRQPELGLD